MVGTLLTTSLNDYGWTSPWRFSGEEGAGHAFRLQHIVSSTGDGALEMAAPGALERDFPPIERGILRIELRVQLEKAGIDIADEETSVLKVYAGDADDNWAFRWHYPFAWPEVGGNVFPRFYVIDGRGTRRKGLEPTLVETLPKRWYEIVTILHLATRTWEFRVDKTPFDARNLLGHELTWWQVASEHPRVCKLRLTSATQGKNWIDHIAIWHDDNLLARTDFTRDEGYRIGRSVVG